MHNEAWREVAAPLKEAQLSRGNQSRQQEWSRTGLGVEEEMDGARRESKRSEWEARQAQRLGGRRREAEPGGDDRFDEVTCKNIQTPHDQPANVELQIFR